MEAEYPLTCSQQPATFPYPESSKLSPHPPSMIMLLFGDIGNVIFFEPT
jgi:hypothetical protein